MIKHTKVNQNKSNTEIFYYYQDGLWRNQNILLEINHFVRATTGQIMNNSELTSMFYMVVY